MIPTISMMLALSIPAMMFAAGDDPKVQDPATTWLERLEGRGYCGAVLAIDGGDILIDRAFGLADVEANRKMTVDTVFDIGSITKQFTAAAIMALAQDGKLSVDDPLSKYLGEMPKDKAGITLQHLLTHSAGFAGEIGRDEDYIDAADFVKLALASKLQFEPGSEYSYSNVGFALLGIVVERVSGKGYEPFLRERFFEPLGMKDTGYVLPKWDRARIATCYQSGKRWGLPIDKNWHADGPGWHLRGNGGILTTLKDMQRWIESLDESKILDEKHCDELFVPRIREGRNADTSYGYGWSVFPSPLGGQVRAHDGGNGVLSADLWWHPGKSRIVFVTSTRSEWIADDVREGVVDFLNGHPRPMPSAARVATASESEAAVGVYRGAGATIEVTTEGGALRVEPKDAKAFAILSDPDVQDLDARLALSSKTDAIATAMQSGDFEELGKHYAGKREPKAFVLRVKSIFEDRVAEVGAWKSHATLGPAPYEEGLVVWVRCVAERETAYAGFIWQDGSLSGITFRDRPPLHSFHPIVGGAYESFSLRPADAALPTVRLEFATPSGTSHLVVSGAVARREFVRDEKR